MSRMLRSRLALRARHLELLDAAGIVTPPPEPDPSPYVLDPGACPHTVEDLRYDGLAAGFPGGLRAQVTCGRCGTSLLIAVRADVTARHGGGGRGGEGDESIMTPR